MAAVARDLPPAALDALRRVTDHVARLGDELDGSGQGEVSIPADDIASLRAFAPDLVSGVRSGSGSIIVTTELGEIFVTPIIGTDGLIEVPLNRFAFVRSHQLVRALVVALNAYVADRGGRFRTISVTPEVITVKAAGEPQGWLGRCAEVVLAPTPSVSRIPHSHRRAPHATREGRPEQVAT